MRITTGKVVEGKIVVEGDPLVEGTTVTVLASEGDHPFELSADDEARLLESLAQADAGKTIGSGELIRGLRKRS